MSTIQLRSLDTHEVVNVLNRCIATCIDGEKGYATAAADVQDTTLRMVLQARSDQRADFVLVLQAAIQKLGASPVNVGTARGTVHRGRMDLRNVVQRSDRAILLECETGERGALKDYQEALSGIPLDALPRGVRTMISNQYAAIHAALEDLDGRLTES